MICTFSRNSIYVHLEAPEGRFWSDTPAEASPAAPTTPHGFGAAYTTPRADIPEPVTPERPAPRHFRRGSANDRLPPPAARAFARGAQPSSPGGVTFEAGMPLENGSIRMEDIGAPVSHPMLSYNKGLALQSLLKYLTYLAWLQGVQRQPKP